MTIYNQVRINLIFTLN